MTTEPIARVAKVETPSPAEAAEAGATGPTTELPRQPDGPPSWLVVALAGAYVAALVALVFAPGGTLLERLRALDGGICAQLPTHSFYPAGQELPLCARNTGIYVGFASTMVVLLSAGRIRATRLPPTAVALVLGAAVAAMAVDGFNSLFLDLRLPHLYQPQNLLRLATGLGTGTAMAAFLVPVANALIWRDEDSHASFASFGQLRVMAPVLVLAFLAVASQADWLLYPLALFSTAGLVTALSLINLVVVLAASGRVGRTGSFGQLFPLYTLMVALAIAELMALFALKTAALHALGAA
jgi:uncharacterized membrane protein